MNDFFWHQDGVFLELVRSPLTVLGILFAVMMAAAAVLVIRSMGETDDD